jgi:hypothetical protein
MVEEEQTVQPIAATAAMVLSVKEQAPVKHVEPIRTDVVEDKPIATLPTVPPPALTPEMPVTNPYKDPGSNILRDFSLIMQTS